MFVITSVKALEKEMKTQEKTINDYETKRKKADKR